MDHIISTQATKANISVALNQIAPKKSVEVNNCRFEDMTVNRLIFLLLVAVVAIVVAQEGGNLAASTLNV